MKGLIILVARSMYMYLLVVIISGGWGSLALGLYLKLCLFIVFGDVSGIWGRILVCLGA